PRKQMDAITPGALGSEETGGYGQRAGLADLLRRTRGNVGRQFEDPQHEFADPQQRLNLPSEQPMDRYQLRASLLRRKPWERDYPDTLRRTRQVAERRRADADDQQFAVSREDWDSAMQRNMRRGKQLMPNIEEADDLEALQRTHQAQIGHGYDPGNYPKIKREQPTMERYRSRLQSEAEIGGPARNPLGIGALPFLPLLRRQGYMNRLSRPVQTGSPYTDDIITRTLTDPQERLRSFLRGESRLGDVSTLRMQRGLTNSMRRLLPGTKLGSYDVLSRTMHAPQGHDPIDVMKNFLRSRSPGALRRGNQLGWPGRLASFIPHSIRT
ncbi:MAG: hypothetical protein ABIH03_06710, partial [Pseudomonadota bacterium]